ncbi:MAG: type II toxin-antitoxin system RelE/ParE family toxin [Symploca sp. SIO2E6]|nr:type II toxin-antitoxin system RelE/ParE family toxin [Symploca sp. SIO2E6]
MKVKFLQPARYELREAVKFYEQQQLGLGKNFRDEVLATIDRIQSFPLGWQLLTENIRRCQTRKFPYGVIYTLDDNEILIIAIAHLHREPDYWGNRV